MTEETLPATQAPQPQHLATLPAGLTTELSKAAEKLKPAGARTGQTELVACLSLVAPVGMSEAERSNWLAAAKMTLTGIPADLLAAGCKAARERADHHSKIVPTIMSEVDEIWRSRKRRLAEAEARANALSVPRLEQHPLPAVPYEETQRILAEVRDSMKATK